MYQAKRIPTPSMSNVTTKDMNTDAGTNETGPTINTTIVATSTIRMELINTPKGMKPSACLFLTIIC